MAGPIRVLEDEVVNQIAAGEVVERPASVVKELVENSLDAGARHITVDVSRGGKRLVRVLDDGEGMSRAEIGQALERHATSKLRHTRDLFGLSTLGFRGEALPSIAAVSRMQITSRAAGGDPAAWAVELEGGRLIAESEVGAPPGTSIEVRDLLFNIPARQKFMKGDATESSHIAEWISRLALAHPEVRMRLRHRRGSSCRVTFDAAPGTRAERVEAVLGDSLRRAEGAGGGVRVEAFLSPPGSAVSGSRQVQLFVGRRPVRDRGLMHALLSGYGAALERGRYPLAAVFVQVEDAEVDVNVHPQKLEVRFADPQAVYAVVSGTVARAIADAPVISVPSAAAPSRRSSDLTLSASRAAERLADYAANRRRLTRPARAPAAVSARPAPPAPPRVEAEARAAYIGQLDRSYLLVELEGDLVLVDQHGAAERVALADLRRAHRAGRLEAQRLLFPEPLEAGTAIADEAQSRLAALGFEIERDGDRCALRSAPAGLADRQPAALVARLLDELAAGGGPRIEDTALVAIACHRALRAGEAIAAGEARRLIAGIESELLAGDPPRTSHGRPLFSRIGSDELAARFR